MAISKPPLQSEIALALGVAPSRITALKRQGMPVSSVADALAWREQNHSPARSKAPPKPLSSTPAIDGDDTETFLEARCRRERSEADKSEIERAQLQGILIDRAGIEMAIETAFRQIRDTIIAVPDRLPIDAPHRTMFRNALRDTLTDAAKMLPTMMAGDSQQNGRARLN